MAGEKVGQSVVQRTGWLWDGVMMLQGGASLWLAWWLEQRCLSQMADALCLGRRLKAVPRSHCLLFP